MRDGGGGDGVCVCVCACVCAIARDETIILVAVLFIDEKHLPVM